MGNININIDDGLHQHSKFKALEKKMTLGEYVSMALEDFGEYKGDTNEK